LLRRRVPLGAAGSEVWGDRGTKGIHALRSTEAGWGWGECARVCRRWRPAGGCGCGVAQGSLLRSSGRDGSWLRRRAPSRRGCHRGRLRWLGGRWGTVRRRWSRCGGQRVTARQAKLAGGLVRRATPRAHDHVKLPSSSRALAHLRGQPQASIPGFPRSYAVKEPSWGAPWGGGLSALPRELPAPPHLPAAGRSSTPNLARASPASAVTWRPSAGAATHLARLVSRKARSDAIASAR
jgi:hypothetical protein